jgi:flagellin-like hook-associated protein FlgL
VKNLIIKLLSKGFPLIANVVKIVIEIIQNPTEALNHINEIMDDVQKILEILASSETSLKQIAEDANTVISAFVDLIGKILPNSQ